jgi:hypothetical protein
MEVSQSDQDLLEDMEGLMEEKEFVFVKQSLLSKQIPTRCSKAPDSSPCSSPKSSPKFHSRIPQLGVFSNSPDSDTNKVNYLKRTIIQTNHLKTKLEFLHLKWDDVTIISLDIEVMYTD